MTLIQKATTAAKQLKMISFLILPDFAGFAEKVYNLKKEISIYER
jgi:hypothetical protein